MIIWLKNQSKVLYRTFQLRSSPRAAPASPAKSAQQEAPRLAPSARGVYFVSGDCFSEKKKAKKKEQHSQLETWLESRPRVLQAKTRQRVKWFGSLNAREVLLDPGRESRAISTFVYLPMSPRFNGGRRQVARASGAVVPGFVALAAVCQVQQLSAPIAVR